MRAQPADHPLPRAERPIADAGEIRSAMAAGTVEGEIVTFDPSLLRPGDALIYFENSLFDWLVALKTWTFAGHCEGYVGNGQSVASRNFIGVNSYPLRLSGLVAVRRPGALFDPKGAASYFRGVQGQKYDTLGLCSFALAESLASPDRQFCSEFLTNWYRGGKIQVVAPEWTADRTAPAQFLQTPALTTVWRKV